MEQYEELRSKLPRHTRDELKQRFAGSEYRRLVEHLLQKENIQSLIEFMMAHKRALDPVEKEAAGNLMDFINEDALRPDFWVQDTWRVYEQLSMRFEQAMITKNHPVFPEIVFCIFEIVSANFACAASEQKEMRKMIGIKKGWFS